MALQAGTTLRGTRAPAGPARTRLPSGQLRAPGRGYPDGRMLAVAESVAGPEFATGHTDLPCQRRDVDPDAFFPLGVDGVTGSRDRAAAEAIRLCGTCPVQLACRHYALADKGVRHGVWGGLLMDDLPARSRDRLLRETERLLQRRRTA